MTILIAVCMLLAPGGDLGHGVLILFDYIHPGKRRASGSKVNQCSQGRAIFN
jgi:hypothetical protein